MITYTPLWETMKQRRITIYALIKNDSFSRGTLDSLKHNRNGVRPLQCCWLYRRLHQHRADIAGISGHARWCI